MLALLAVLAFGGCTPTSALRAEVAEVGADVRTARRRGALRCAPRELALAEAHGRFASIELEQGSLVRARAHLRTASLHAQAALDRVGSHACDGARPPAAEPGVNSGAGAALDAGDGGEGGR